MTEKVELFLNEEQQAKVKKGIGLNRFIYNLYLTVNGRLYEKEGRIMDAGKYMKMLYNEYIPKTDGCEWIKNEDEKLIERNIQKAYSEFTGYLNGERGYPSFMRKKADDGCMYIEKSKAEDFSVNRSMICIPGIGDVRFDGSISLDDRTIDKVNIRQEKGKYFLYI